MNPENNPSLQGSVPNFSIESPPSDSSNEKSYRAGVNSGEAIPESPGVYNNGGSGTSVNLTNTSVPPIASSDMAILPISTQPKTVMNDTATNSQLSEGDLLKQWVSQAESIVGLTEDNPFERAELISKLKQEYNYGRDIGGESSKEK